MKKRALLLTVAALVMSACAAHSPDSARSPALEGAAVRVIDVYKSPTCTCCHDWEAYLRSHGYTVRSIVSDNLTGLKNSYRIPEESWSCHTAQIGGYFVEGHVPLEAIEDLLATKPRVDGIALPGMPAGSPGMPGLKAGPFEILAVTDGVTSAFGTY